MKAEYIDHMGTDLSVVNAARVSFDKESYLEWDRHKAADGLDHDNCYSLKENDKKLIKFLATHKHELPFAHTAITLRMTAPIPIRTQCFKHKIGFVENEISRRYVSSTPEFYRPDVWRYKAEDKKQGSRIEGQSYQYVERNLEEQAAASPEHAYQVCLEAYENLLSLGYCEEQARFVLPQGMMTSWVWTGSLLAFSRFYNLRAKPDAQKEVQELAEMVGDIIKPLYPVSWEALT